MKYSRFRLLAVVLFVCLAAVVHVALSVPKDVQAAVSPVTTARTSRPSVATGLYAQAARALRQRNLQEARQLLDEVAESHPKEAARVELVEGFYAAEAGKADLAQELLAKAADPDHELEDWRLMLLAESSLKNDDTDAAGIAVGALDHLLASCPDSSLRPQAYLQAARLAYDEGDERRTLSLIQDARREGVSGKAAVELENLAWKTGQAIDDDQVSREAGRRLLAEAPLTAGALGVADTFRAMDGDLDWNRILSAGEVKQRARSFLSVERLSAALDTLDNVPQAQRDFEWHLLRARVLIESGQPKDALSALDTAPAHTREDRASVEWERAVATARLAARGDRGDRRSQLESSHEHLAEAVRLGGESQLSRDTLEGLYDDFLDAGLVPQAVDVLKTLRRVDPGDSTGARDLWERGWTAYRRDDFETAVTLWADLAEVYPEHGDAQRGRYWQARALEKLGRPGDARRIYSGMIASSDTSDFYGRRAMARLGETPVSAEFAEIQLAQASESKFPSDPRLERAKLLTDLGLDELARREMELMEDEANPRDLLALRALVLGREGKRRESIALLREAFPALGGPQQSTVPEEILRAYYPMDYQETIVAAARANGLPPSLVAGIIRQESAFDPRATSPVGARGLMQLMPPTAREMASRLDVRAPSNGLYDPEYSIELGAAYLKQLLQMFDGNVELAVASYNGGPNRIQRLWNEAGPAPELDDFVENLGLEESRDYVKRILVLADSYRQLYPEAG
ncbi:MAG TPA: lytic transglycosylase domain-containing protein [Thermoanaerobaculia bacterium]|nr:lytic transglycosylase domain-containing protein [Thermoanaerobaculia bacterium]